MPSKLLSFSEFLEDSSSNSVFSFPKYRICVNQKHVCDGMLDCPNGEDESDCPKRTECNATSKCEQLCIRTSNGEGACACRVGYILSDNKQK